MRQRIQVLGARAHHTKLFPGLCAETRQEEVGRRLGVVPLLHRLGPGLRFFVCLLRLALGPADVMLPGFGVLGPVYRVKRYHILELMAP